MHFTKRFKCSPAYKHNGTLHHVQKLDLSIIICSLWCGQSAEDLWLLRSQKMTLELLSSLTPYFCSEADDHGAEEVYWVTAIQRTEVIGDKISGHWTHFIQ
jgi:hypothetical protein